jgi:putative mRNA 3-end processing factor
MATEAAAPVMPHRLGDVSIQTTPYGAKTQIGGASVSFHPAGHIPGSAQIRIEVGGEVWVVSGDYKPEPDGLCESFELVPCHAFISECTFGLPAFKWAPQSVVAEEINGWWASNAAGGRFSLLGAYSLGKAQRLMSLLDPSIGPILTHGAVEATNEVLRAQGYSLPATTRVTGDLDVKAHTGGIVIAPPSAFGTPWAKKFGRAATGFASGWMRLRGVRRRRAADRGFVLSDHADWPGLNDTIRATGCEKIFVTHGYTEIFNQWLLSQGYDSAIVATEYTGEGADTDDAAEVD